MNTVLGIDLGTQHLKVLFYDYEMRSVTAVESAPLDLDQDEHGVAEQHTHWWISALEAAMAKVTPSIKASARAIAVSGQQHGFVALDQADQSLLPVKLWCDTSTQLEAEQLMLTVGGAERCIELIGNPILVGYTAPKVRWMRDQHPQRWDRLDCILLPHDFLNLYLTGERCMEAGDASGTGFFDIVQRRWSEELLAAIDPDRDLRACLPTVHNEPRIIGELRLTAAESLGLPRGIPVASGGGDNMMGAIGTGNVSPGAVTASLGTSGTVYAYSSSPVVDPTGNIAAFCSSTGGWLPLLCTMNCTVSTELTRNLLTYQIDEFEAQVASAPRGAEGVVMLPFFNGERTPNLPKAKGCLVGLDANNMRTENLCRAALEGATFALRFGVEELRRLGLATDRVTLTGGGANSATWRQVVADVLDLPVTMTQQDEGAAYGAALQALSLLDGSTSMEQLVGEHLQADPSRCYEPNADAADFYRGAYLGYQTAVGSIRDLYS